MNVKQAYFLLAVACLVAAVVDTSWHRFAWMLFALAFIIATDKIKDVEKAKRKERDLTTIELKKEMLEGWDASLEERYALVITQITNTADTLLKQLATYVRVGTPDKTCEHCEKKEE